jgi:two-component system, chemotaxis family, protein-glutamate methylesterase/glutaminase
MPRHDIIVVGASAGGVEALQELVAGLPADLPAAVFVVLHVPAHGPSLLPSILARAGPLPAAHAEDGEPIRPGRIYVAPPDHHLMLEPGRVRLVVGPRENGVRPAADALFRSAARAYGPRVVGVVVSGSLTDGTLGLAAINGAGGVAIVQDPAEALFGGMPQNALNSLPMDYRLKIADIGPTLRLLAQGPEGQDQGEAREAMAGDIEPERYATNDRGEELATQNKQLGQASGFTCPECQGSLWELRDGDLARFECRVGHAYSSESFLEHQAEAVEAALWSAINLQRERAATFEHLADLYGARQPTLATRYRGQAKDMQEQAEVIRNLLLKLVRAGDVG